MIDRPARLLTIVNSRLGLACIGGSYDSQLGSNVDRYSRIRSWAGGSTDQEACPVADAVRSGKEPVFSPRRAD